MVDYYPAETPLSENKSSREKTSAAKHTSPSDDRKLSEILDAQPVRLAWKNICVSHPKTNRTILRDVCGFAEPGELVALMGASGAGKTTLLNTLLCRNLKGLQISGQVLVDNHQLLDKITRVSGYVQQEEMFCGRLTVEEHLRIQATLRLSNLSSSKRQARVDELLRLLDLLKCRNSKIGISGIQKGISGGEAKRLLFASELLNNPPLMFCDEPTTGLDSAMAESVVKCMKELTKRKHTIICTIHQPSTSVFRTFDKVFFLANGRVAYYGTPQGCVAAFTTLGYPCPKNYNPADLIIEKLAVEPGNEENCKNKIKEICDSFESSEAGQEFTGQSKETSATSIISYDRKTAPFHMQISALLRRSFIDTWRNPAMARAKLIQKTFLGLFLGSLYFQTETDTIYGIQNTNGAMYFIVAELTYSTLFGILSFMPADFPLVSREYHDGLYCPASYYISKVLSFLPLFTVDGILMMIIAFTMIALNNSVKTFFELLAVGVLIEWCAAACGIMLSTMFPSYAVAMSVAGPLLTILSLVGGIYANVGELPAYISWMQYISWFKYGFEAFAIIEWTEVEEDGCVVPLNKTQHLLSTMGHQQPEVCLGTDDILDLYSLSRSNLGMDIGAMLGFIIIFSSIGLLALTVRLKMSR